jgi:hypothetical protein
MKSALRLVGLECTISRRAAWSSAPIMAIFLDCPGGGTLRSAPRLMSLASAWALRNWRRKPMRSISFAICRPFSVCRGRRNRNPLFAAGPWRAKPRSRQSAQITTACLGLPGNPTSTPKAGSRRLHDPVPSRAPQRGSYAAGRSRAIVELPSSGPPKQENDDADDQHQ